MAQQALERSDPRPRRKPGTPGTLLNGRPDRKYLLANPNDPTGGLQYHLDCEWHKVNGGKDGDKERVHSGRVEPNGEVSFQGQVLIWLELDEFNAREADKQAVVNAREAKSKGPGGIDNVVGADGKLASNY